MPSLESQQSSQVGALADPCCLSVCIRAVEAGSLFLGSSAVWNNVVLLIITVTSTLLKDKWEDVLYIGCTEHRNQVHFVQWQGLKERRNNYRSPHYVVFVKKISTPPLWKLGVTSPSSRSFFSLWFGYSRLYRNCFTSFLLDSRYNARLKGTVSRGFLLQVFFMNHLPRRAWK